MSHGSVLITASWLCLASSHSLCRIAPYLALERLEMQLQALCTSTLLVRDITPLPLFPSLTGSLQRDTRRKLHHQPHHVPAVPLHLSAPGNHTRKGLWVMQRWAQPGEGWDCPGYYPDHGLQLQPGATTAGKLHGVEKLHDIHR